ncbi:hypothetical protein FA13DRAFT_1174665 [Coprinellus micaceus]|uniref:Uncharacterized protein n=1 Tax=Coprinellus micaceus TaxID=71717 RepID=A0A4Y7SVG5_COPMI|nr:hypothetical protein FA13DRAFT_1174665 [Coprinellus micaceus]
MILDFLTDLNDEADLSLAPAHDYLDDLESFFNVFCSGIFQFNSDGSERALTDKARSIVAGWDNESAGLALASKAMPINPTRRQRELAMDLIEESWGPVCRDLFDEFSEWVWEMHVEKGKLVRGYEKNIRAILRAAKPGSNAALPETAEAYYESVFAPLYRKAQSHYEAIVDMLHRAVVSLEDSPESSGPAPSVSIPRTNLKGRDLKRPAQHH